MAALGRRTDSVFASGQEDGVSNHSRAREGWPLSGAEDIARWNEVSDAYAKAISGNDSFYRRFAPFLWEQLGDLSRSRILDLGCGHGWLADKLASAGATVTGVDGSSDLIRLARSAFPEIRFEVADLVDGLPAGMGAYEAVVAHMVLMDLPALDRVLDDVKATLAPTGVFVFSILHPCFFAQEPVQDTLDHWSRHVTGYLGHDKRWIDSFGGHWHYHRPLSWYVTQLSEHGFVVTALSEPLTLPQHTAAPTEWTAYEQWFSQVPTMVAFACRPRHALLPSDRDERGDDSKELRA